mmetsp:Transcript_50659/g.131704  ORF Transcript_50659/g.131704 Transcript_50659/m.131704 type:complete len:215 (+) Transcript_50659:579-1223(+)
MVFADVATESHDRFQQPPESPHRVPVHRQGHEEDREREREGDALLGLHEWHLQRVGGVFLRRRAAQRHGSGWGRHWPPRPQPGLQHGDLPRRVAVLLAGVVLDRPRPRSTDPGQDRRLFPEVEVLFSGVFADAGLARSPPPLGLSDRRTGERLRGSMSQLWFEKHWRDHSALASEGHGVRGYTKVLQNNYATSNDPSLSRTQLHSRAALQCRHW